MKLRGSTFVGVRSFKNVPDCCIFGPYRNILWTGICTTVYLVVCVFCNQPVLLLRKRTKVWHLRRQPPFGRYF